MDYYLFAARSVTHAQRMARLLSDAGISAKIRRAGAAITERGCGYTLEIPRRHAARAMQACRAGGVLVIKAKDKLRLLPPLNIDKGLLEQAVHIMKGALK